MKPVMRVMWLVSFLGLIWSLAAPAWAASEDRGPSPWGNRGVLIGGVYKPLQYPLPEVYTIKRRGGPWPFLLTLLMGNRVGLEWNDGRRVRKLEYVRALPYAGWTVIPWMCYETFSEKSMQYIANKEGLDRKRQAKYEAHISELEASGQHEEAAYFRRINPFELRNRPPDPLARIPKKELDGFKGNFKAFWVDMTVGHRAAQERMEGRGLRKLEKVYFLQFPKLIEAFEAMFGRSMEEIARKEGLDEVWRRKRLKAQQAIPPEELVGVQADVTRHEVNGDAVVHQPGAARLHAVHTAGVPGR